MTYTLFGDGLHDDTSAIQELLDSGLSCVTLPPPAKHYLISNTLVLHSNQELRLDKWTEIILAPKANVPMLTNSDYENGNSRIAVTGGIWNGNNLCQAPNPQMVTLHGENRGDGFKRLPMPTDWPSDPITGHPSVMAEIHDLPWHPKRYWGDLMLFVKIDHFDMRDVTLRNPVTYAVHSAMLTNFTFTNITFDFNEGHPSPNNMDGLHFDGGCRFGKISNLKGACYDDLLAFNGEDGRLESPLFGPISDIEVDGIFAERCHSAARFLSNGSLISNITIRNVYGTFYRYAFGFTHYFPKCKTRGAFDGLVFENLFISKALPLPSDWNRCPDWGLFWGEGAGTVGTMRISGLHRIEETTPVPSFEFEQNFEIDHLTIENCTTENHLEQPIAFFQNAGKINHLTLRNNTIRPFNGTENVRNFVNTGTIQEQELL